MQKTLRIKNDIHELSMMNQFLEEAGEELGLSTAFMMSLNLVMEEAVSNIIFYAYKGDVEDAVDISLVREGGELIVTLIDHGIAFDPTLRKDPDITLSAEDRPIGGLGIFLIKKIMDEVSYQRVDERNVFIMKKKITDIWKFITYDIWRITEDEVTRTKFSLYNIIKTIICS